MKILVQTGYWSDVYSQFLSHSVIHCHQTGSPWWIWECVCGCGVCVCEWEREWVHMHSNIPLPLWRSRSTSGQDSEHRWSVCVCLIYSRKCSVCPACIYYIFSNNSLDMFSCTKKCRIEIELYITGLSLCACMCVCIVCRAIL